MGALIYFNSQSSHQIPRGIDHSPSKKDQLSYNQAEFLSLGKIKGEISSPC